MDELSLAAPIVGLLDVMTAQPTSVNALAERLRDGAAGPSPDEVTRELQARGDVVEMPDGWVNLLAAADGAVLTHVLTGPECELGVLAAGGDLDLWARLADEGLAFDGGGTVTTRWAVGPRELPPGSGAGLEGPSGWLDGYEPGQLLGLRLRDGCLEIEIVDDDDLHDTADRSQDVVRCCTEAAAARNCQDLWI
jgi:hypothetical protein